jgi:ATP-GRASP peptide maturase of grasp-with-spasm system
MPQPRLKQMKNRMIVIFSRGDDISTRDVENKLTNMSQDVVIIEPTAAMEKFSEISNDGIIFESSDGKRYNLLDATAIWWRRTGIGMNNLVDEVPEKMVAGEQDLSMILHGPRNHFNEEFVDLKDYIYDTLYKKCPRHIGNPRLMGLNRIYTLDMAKEVGLMVPDYAVITNYNQLEKLDYISDKFVSKAISNGIYDFFGHDAYYSYTEARDKADFANKDVKLFPSLVMSLVEKSFEVRSFYLNGKFYSMAIFSQRNKQTAVDFRKYSSELPNKNEPFKLPDDVEEKLDKLYKKLDLNTGSADFMVDKDGNYVFLEINPVGQFQMTSLPCNYNLEQKIANYLAYGS